MEEEPDNLDVKLQQAEVLEILGRNDEALTLVNDG